jgi:hypothetical protein
MEVLPMGQKMAARGHGFNSQKKYILELFFS